MCNNKCIFCLQNAEMTKEHIIPDSIGGSLQIKNVCKTCNSILGANVDGPYCSGFLSTLNREKYHLSGKKGNIPSLLKDNNWVISEGDDNAETKIRISNGAPQLITPKIEVQQDINKSVIHMELPAELSQEKLDKIIDKRIASEYKRLHPNCSIDSVETQKELETIKASALKKAEIIQSRPKLTHKFTINLLDIKREYLKIAYELAFCQYGMDYILNSKTAKSLRKAVLDGDIINSQIHGCIPWAFSNGDFYPEDQYEFIFCGKHIAIKLFDIWGVIKVLSDTENYPNTDNSLRKVLSIDGELIQKTSGLLCWHKQILPKDDN